MAAGDIVYFQGQALYVLDENETAVVAAPFPQSLTFYAGDEYEGYPLTAAALTDADGNPAYPAGGAKETKSSGTKAQPKTGKD